MVRHIPVVCNKECNHHCLLVIMVVNYTISYFKDKSLHEINVVIKNMVK